MANGPDHGLEDVATLYSNLRLETDDSIRILDIQPGAEATIQVALWTATLSSNPYYEALSYTWGDSLEGHTIIVNNYYSVPVTDNLFRALSGLRRRHGRQTMWIDALCINQGDNKEKSWQIRLMTKIYRRSRAVAIWMGAYTPPRDSWATRVSGSTQKAVEVFVKPKITSPESLTPERLTAMDQALEKTRPKWHTRAWTIQEVMLAHHLVLCYGSERVFYRQSSTEISYKETAGAAGKTHLEEFVRALEARAVGVGDGIVPNPRLQPPLPISRVAGQLRQTEAKDARDFVYSLLGIVTAKEASMIDVDYNLPCVEIYAKATFASLRCTPCLEILRLVSLNRIEKIDLPSWSVDFADTRTTAWTGRHFQYHEYGEDDPDDNPDLRKRERSPKRPNFLHSSITSLDASRRYLTIRGLTCDTVTSILVSSFGQGDSKTSVRIFVQQAVAQAYKTLRDSRYRKQELRPPFGAYFLNVLRGHLTGNRRALFKETRLDKPSYPLVWREDGHHSDPLKWWNRYLYMEPLHKPTAGYWHMPPRERLELEHYGEYARSVYGDGKEMTLFMTASGLIGLAPASVVEGDVLVFVQISCQFVMLRRQEERFTFQGLPWVNGFMDRNLWDLCYEEIPSRELEETFVIE